MLDSLLLHIGTAYETEIWGRFAVHSVRRHQRFPALTIAILRPDESSEIDRGPTLTDHSTGIEDLVTTVRQMLHDELSKHGRPAPDLRS